MKYTVKEVRQYARITDGMVSLPKLTDMLTELADRIEADEAKALGTCPKHGVEYVGECSGCAMTLPEKDFTHPPAQAAQLDGFFIHCDGVTVNVTEAYRQAGFDVLPPTVTLSALQILALAKRPANYGLFPYIGEHRAYGDNEAIILTPGMRFLAVPPATWGGAYSDPPNQQFMRGPAADKPAAEPVAQDDCHVCGCVHDGQCLCTRPNAVSIVFDSIAVRKVIAEVRRCAGNNNAKFHLTWADKLEAALQEKGNG